MSTANKRSLAATVLLFAAIIFIELFGIPKTNLTHAQEITAAILVVAAVLWVSEWVSLFVVSFLILGLEIVWLLPSLNAVSETAFKSSVFFSPFFSNIILLFLGGFVLSSLMQKYGLDIRFAQAILRKTKGLPSMTLLGIILACSFLSMWISNTATTAMMLTMVFPLIKKIPEANPFRKALVLCIPFACNLGGIGTPIGTPPNAIALTYLTEHGYTVTFAKWMALTAPFLVLFLFLLWQMLLRLFPAGNLRLEVPERHTGTFGFKHWAAIAVFATTALGWFFASALGLATGTVGLFPIIVCFWFGLLDTKDFRDLPWDVLYMVSGGLALGVALKITGLGEVIIHALPLNGSPAILLMITAAVAGIMSTVMSNTATAGLVIPLVMNLPFENEYILSLVIALALMCSMAMALPVSTPPNAIAFSSRAIKSKDMIITGGLITLIGYACVALLGPMYWRFILSVMGV
ncbi:SLC13 family permease [Teredinibacter purpureus]|uniref:SLC13 family permease n=1 Tax=Teredinibacter purpureus TaxID=2731756 RepID=UPI0005F7C966|nr:DASS family sodium-coupled anion symporter [Teredinibacter purpureus]